MKVNTLWGEEEVLSRVCKKCEIEKPLTDFEWRSDLSYVRGSCKECRKVMTNDIAKLKKDNPYPENHKCEICGKGEDEASGTWVRKSNGNKKKAFCLDHDHNTGKFRGWLCHDCNRALGQFHDNVTILENAIQYLQKSI